MFNLKIIKESTLDEITERVRKTTTNNYKLLKQNQQLIEHVKELEELVEGLNKENAELLGIVTDLEKAKKKSDRQRGAAVTNLKKSQTKAAELEEQLKALKIRRTTRSKTISSDK